MTPTGPASHFLFVLKRGRAVWVGDISQPVVGQKQTCLFKELTNMFFWRSWIRHDSTDQVLSSFGPYPTLISAISISKEVDPCIVIDRLIFEEHQNQTTSDVRINMNQ